MEVYDIYREAVGGQTWNGDKMKDFNEMPEKQRNGWKAVEEAKLTHVVSSTCETCQKMEKEALTFLETFGFT